MPAQIIGTQATAVELYLAFNGVAPSNPIYNNYVSYITATSPSAAALALGNSVAAVNDATLANTVLANLGVSAATTNPAAFTALSTALAQAFAAFPTSRGQVVLNLVNILTTLEGNATYGAAAAAFNNATAAAFSFASNAANTGPAFTLTAGLNDLTGSGGADVFKADLVNNANTFQSGDIINGGAGVDTLMAVLGNSSAFAVRATTSNLENVFFTAQSTNGIGSSGGNNVDTTGQKVTVDAELMQGVTQWWSTESRADLKIEDVRILDSQITKDITIGLRDTDPGSIGPAGLGPNNKVDFEVYFSPESLRSAVQVTTNSITISVGDASVNMGTQAQFETVGTLPNPNPGGNGFVPPGPLGNFAFSAFTLAVNGLLTQFQFTNADIVSINLATTFALQEAAFQRAILNAQNVVAPGGPTSLQSLGFTLTQEAQPYIYSSQDVPSITRSVPAYQLTAPAGMTVTPGQWIFNSASQNSIQQWGSELTPFVSSTTNPLITSTIILDNVGREDEAGTLTIGSMSTHGGVDRFEITVQNNGDNAFAGTPSGSWLAHMQSTNNTLREVTVVNDAAGIANPDYLYLGTNMDQAGNNLAIMQDWPGGLANPAAIAAVTTSLLNPDGLTDVRLFDASAFKGDVFVGATLTANTIRKFQNLVDTAVDDKADDVAFQYKTGSGNDSINLVIDGQVAASNSTFVAGRHDFTFLADGGAGNDNIQVSIVSGNTGSAEDWYVNQHIRPFGVNPQDRNVTINGGDGNDTIRKPGAGDATINGGAGNDSIYADNTGVYGGAGPLYNLGRAAWVFNTSSVATGASPTTRDANIEDLASDAAVSVNAVNAQLTVTFMGLTKTVPIADSVGKVANVAITDLSVNQAIKLAIASDDTLNKLLIAKDGPGHTLIIESLIDGLMGETVGDNLSVTFGTAALTAGQAAVPALTLFSGAATATLLDGYVAQFGTFGGNLTDGGNSVSVSDNLINGGTGNDVMVLGTTVGATLFASSNDIVKFEGSFGNDVVANFAAGGLGVDRLDFTSIGGTTLAAVTVDKSITIAAAATLATSSTVTELAAVQALYGAANAAAQTHVFVVFGTDNVGRVYTIADPAAATNAVATLAGSIDLADTAWGTITADNFNLTPDAPLSVPPPPPPPPPGLFTTVDLGTTDLTATAAAEAFVYDFKMVAGRATKAGDGEVTITGFDVVNDKLVFNDVGTGTVLTEAQFKVLAGVVLSESPFAPINSTIFFDPDAGVAGGVKLLGIQDAALVQIVVETLA